MLDGPMKAKPMEQDSIYDKPDDSYKYRNGKEYI
jgi:hypothetical protein